MNFSFLQLQISFTGKDKEKSVAPVPGVAAPAASPSLASSMQPTAAGGSSPRKFLLSKGLQKKTPSDSDISGIRRYYDAIFLRTFPTISNCSTSECKRLFDAFVMLTTCWVVWQLIGLLYIFKLTYCCLHNKK